MSVAAIAQPEGPKRTIARNMRCYTCLCRRGSSFDAKAGNPRAHPDERARKRRPSNPYQFAAVYRKKIDRRPRAGLTRE